jgi:hypothetical protein
LKKSEKILPVDITVINISNKQYLNDNNLATSISYTSGCSFTYDFGIGFSVLLEKIKIFP